MLLYAKKEEKRIIRSYICDRYVEKENVDLINDRIEFVCAKLLHLVGKGARGILNLQTGSTLEPWSCSPRVEDRTRFCAKSRFRASLESQSRFRSPFYHMRVCIR